MMLIVLFLSVPCDDVDRFSVFPLMMLIVLFLSVPSDDVDRSVSQCSL